MERRRLIVIGITAVVAVAVAAIEAGADIAQWVIFVVAGVAGFLIASLVASIAGSSTAARRMSGREQWIVVAAVATVPFWEDRIGSTGAVIIVGFVAAFLITLFIRYRNEASGNA